MFGEQTPHLPGSNTSGPPHFPATTEGWSRRYASLGLPVVVLRPGTKEPALGRGWARMATTDPDEAARQVAAHPGCNLAVLLGVEARPGRYTALLDIDRGGRRTLRTLLRRGSPLRPLARLLARTANTYTGRGGRHYWLLLPDRLQGVHKLGKGLELKGAPTGRGGPFAVVEPSVTTREYVWGLCPWQNVEEVPESLARLLYTEAAARQQWGRAEATLAPAPRRASDDSEQAALADCIARWPVRAEQERNDRQASVLAYLVAARLFDRETTLRVAEAWLQTFEGVFATFWTDALAHLRTAERSTRKALETGVLQHRDGHVERIAAQELEPWQHALVWSACDPNTRKQPRCKGQAGALCRSRQEAAFVEALVLMVRYKLLATEEGTIRATREQLQAVIAIRHPDMATDSRETFQRLLRKYVDHRTEAGKVYTASRRTLLYRTRAGYWPPGQAVGVPSEFAIGHLAHLLLLDPDEELEPSPQELQDRLGEAEARKGGKGARAHDDLADWGWEGAGLWEPDAPRPGCDSLDT